MKILPIAVLAMCCLCELGIAQGRNQESNSSGQASSPAASSSSGSTGTSTNRSGNVSGSSSQPSQNSPEQNAGPQNVGPQNAGPQNGGPQSNNGDRLGQGSPNQQRTSGRRFSELKPLRTRRGTFPGFMQRAGERRNAAFNQNAAGNVQANVGQQIIGNQNSGNRPGMQQRPGSGNVNQQNLQQVFLNNALLFDSNSDNQLAAHELSNLFLVLVSENNQNNNYYGNPWFNNGIWSLGTRYDSANQNQPRQTAPSQPGGTGSMAIGGGGSGGSDINVFVGSGVSSLQGVQLQDALLLFLFLTLQFDQDGDGALNQSELSRFAARLLNNDLNLAGTAQQGR